MIITPSLELHENHPLASLTSFKIGGPARYFVEIDQIGAIPPLIRFATAKKLPIFILGQGSNSLIHDAGFPGLVIKIGFKGQTILAETAQNVTLGIAAGEIWDDIAAEAARQGWWGIENLAHIPGSIGAFPIQNVSAYGQEAQAVIEAVEAFDRETDQMRVIPRTDCHFGYRRSIFNSTNQNRYIIGSIRLSLRKNGQPNLDYQDLQNYFTEHTGPITLADIRQAVITIRERKLPDPRQIGNAGSFFKNVSLTPQEFILLKARLAQHFSSAIIDQLESLRRRFGQGDDIKLPTAFFIDICGLKGATFGGAALHGRHALVIVNQDQRATASDVMNLARLIRQEVYRQTGLIITPEPNLIGFPAAEMTDYFRLD
jgi:UDP-N-acetylmuramate dehydrogenase